MIRCIVFNCFLVMSSVAAVKGQQLAKVPKWEIDKGGSASALNAGNRNYVKEIRIARPMASTTAAQLAAINPSLPKVLPGFNRLMETAQVSSQFDAIYDKKLATLKRGEVLTPHNYFDLETALRLEDPTTKRKVFLVQTDMDVVTDGSDPERSASMESYDLARSSDWYLPQTSYGWAGSGGRNPFLDYYPAALEKLEKVRTRMVAESQLDKGVIWREMIAACDAQIYRIKMRGMSASTRKELASRRFLLADRDPFVVLPVPWVNGSAAWSPQIGDYVAVVYKDRIYPAILGDSGPRDKIGEASLKLALMLNPKANGKTRAVEELTVTYLFFPHTKKKFGPPNLAEWRATVMSLLGEIGGVSSPAVVYDWNAGN
jgi:hypothetical protein